MSENVERETLVLEGLNGASTRAGRSTKMKVSPEDFIRIVFEVAKEGLGWDEVAARTGLEANSAKTKASKLKTAQGIKLPTLTNPNSQRGRGGKRVDYAALRELAASLEQGMTEEGSETPAE